jgi:hypothetical protein
LSGCNGYPDEGGGISPCGHEGGVVEDGSEGCGLEWLVIFTRDDKVRVEFVFESLDCGELKLVVLSAGFFV